MERNRRKYSDRDTQKEGNPQKEYNYLAADTVSEIAASLSFLEQAGWKNEENFEAEHITSGKRKTLLRKVPEAVKIYKDMIFYYSVNIVSEFRNLPDGKDFQWTNLAGKIYPRHIVEETKEKIRKKSFFSWEEFSSSLDRESREAELSYAVFLFKKETGIGLSGIGEKEKPAIIKRFTDISEEVIEKVKESRSKDFLSEIRKKLYTSEDQMRDILGDPEKDPVLFQLAEEIEKNKKKVADYFESL